MATNYELQRLKLNKNLHLITSVRETNNVTKKIDNIEYSLAEGADVNFVDRNDDDNAPIHIAVHMGEPEIVQFLISKGADLNLKNLNGETPLVIAQGLSTDKKQDIVKLLQAPSESDNNNTVPVEISQYVSQNRAPTKKNPSKNKKFAFIKRSGTAGVSGQLYETNLLTMVLMRALKTHIAKPGEAIEQFYLGTNISGVGELDDICLRYRVKGHKNDILLFVQAKYRENPEKGKVSVDDLRSASGDFSLRKYFDSYLKIKDKFQKKSKKDHTGSDVMFEGEFGSVECNFILYTPAKDSLADGAKSYTKKVSKMVDYLIKTKNYENDEDLNKEIFQYNCDEDDIEYLTKLTVKERIKKLGSEFLDLVMSNADKSQVILAAEVIATYHVVMGRQVLQISEEQQLDDTVNRIWQFRPDFFTSDDEYLITLRDTFYKILSTTRCDQSEIGDKDKDSFDLILKLHTPSPSTTSTTGRQPKQSEIVNAISRLIGKLVTYDEDTKKLHVKDVKEFKDLFKGKFEESRECLNKLEINKDDIITATKIKLQYMPIKLPLAFGNLDLIVKKIDRVTTIAEKLITFIILCKDKDNIVEINENVVGPGKTLQKGIIDSNGGIGSAVGNLLVFDPQTKAMKFDMKNRSLPNEAASLLNALKDPKNNPTNIDLSSIRIRINISGFPKDSFHGNEYDKRQARDYLSKLWFYTNQEKVDTVKSIIKKGIDKYYNPKKDKNQFKLSIHTDSIFLKSHDKIQKWWMNEGETDYLSQTSEIFESAKLDVLEDPLLHTLDYMCHLKIQNIGVEFNQDAIRALELDKNTKRIYNVITNANMLSAIKIMQYFETPSLRSKCTFIDFDYILSVPLNDYNIMLMELKQTKIEGRTDDGHNKQTNDWTLIVIYEKLKYYEGLCNKLKEIIKLFKGNKIIIVTESGLANEIKTHAGNNYISVKDGKTDLTDLLESSQVKILEESTIVFQGEELPVKSVLDQEARKLVRTEVLCKLLKKEKIEIGYPLMDDTYKRVDHFIDRTLNKQSVNTLYDIEEEVVTVVGRPGLGKSALLTHLSLNTKQLHPLPWIVRVNLEDYINEFNRWQEQKFTIDVSLVLNFLCTIALKNNIAQIQIKLNHNAGKVTVSHDNENINPLMLFELEWFLYLYNSGQVIFLFDKFNAMNPHYEKEVLQILKLLKHEEKRMWITTCPYNHTRKPLEKEFGTPYELDPYNVSELHDIVDRFYKTNRGLEQLNYEQLETVRSLLERTDRFHLINDPERELLPIFSITFQLIYNIIVAFFKSDINQASPMTAKHKIKENFQIDLDQYTTIDEILGRTPDDEELELAGTPIHIYIAANYFRACLKDFSFLLSEEEARDKWNLLLNTMKLYHHSIGTQMNRIFSQEDVDDTSIVTAGGDIKRNFYEQYKKLGLFTIAAKQDDLSKLLKPDDICKAQEAISRVERGEVRNTQVDCEVDRVPRFAHLVLAEYFAIDCVVDLMKSVAESTNDDDLINPFKCASMWQMIMNVVLFNSPPSVRQRFNYKLQTDGTLAKVANTNECRNVLFELVLKRNRTNEASESPVIVALNEGCDNIANLILTSIQSHLHQDNVDEIIKLLGRSKDKLADFGREYGGTLGNLMDAIAEMDFDRLGSILTSGRLTEVPLQYAADYASSATASELCERVSGLTENVERLYRETGNISRTLGDVFQSTIKNIVDGVRATVTGQDTDSRNIPELD